MKAAVRIFLMKLFHEHMHAIPGEVGRKKHYREGGNLAGLIIFKQVGKQK